MLGEQQRKSIQMNWFPNDSSAEGVSSLVGSGVCAQKIWKIRTLEMPFPAIWALNHELQFDFKKGKTLAIIFFCTPVDQGQQGCTPPYKCTPAL